MWACCRAQKLQGKTILNIIDEGYGSIKHYLGIYIQCSREECKVILSQSHAIQKILERFSMSDCKASPTPMEAKLVLVLHVEGEKKLSTAPYCELVGSIMYLMMCTRPDLLLRIGVLSKFSSSPTDEHWKSAKRLIRYLQGTVELKIEYRTSRELPLMAYCDAD